MKAESFERHYYQHQSDAMNNSASERSSRKSNKCRKCVGMWTLSKRGSARGPPKEDPPTACHQPKENPPPPQSSDVGFWDDELMEKMSLASEDEFWDDESMASKAPYPEREPEIWKREPRSVQCPKKKPCNKHWQAIKEAVNRHKNEMPQLTSQTHAKKKLPLGTLVFDIYQNHPEFDSYSQKKPKTSKVVKSPQGKQINNETKAEPRICNTPEGSLVFDLHQKYSKGIPSFFVYISLDW